MWGDRKQKDSQGEVLESNKEEEGRKKGEMNILKERKGERREGREN